jgi:hypothetical protein
MVFSDYQGQKSTYSRVLGQPLYCVVGEEQPLTRKFHEWPAATADMTVLTGVLGCRTLRRTVQVRLGSNPPAVARWHSHLRGLATAIHEIFGLKLVGEHDQTGALSGL